MRYIFEATYPALNSDKELLETTAESVDQATAFLLSRLMSYEMNSCCICHGPLVLLGTLGRLRHYRCRNCGMDQSKPLPQRKRAKETKACHIKQS